MELDRRSEADVPECGFTHGGKFHSDDVFATALLRILKPTIQIMRGFEVPEDFDGIVYDIGRGRFDHHQMDKEYRDNGVPYAAFGLVWREYGSYLVGEEEALRFDEHFVQGLDESDNTGCSHMLADLIGDFNPGWDSEASYDDCFWKAETFAEEILNNHLEKVYGLDRAKGLVTKAMQESTGHILVLPVFAPWKSFAIGSGFVYAIYPSNRGGYGIQGVPVSSESNELICPFPKEWCGRTEQELQAMTGVKTIRFCHPNAFLCSTGTLEDAIQIAELSLAFSDHEVL